MAAKQNLSEIRPGSFVYRWNGALDAAACDDIIERFEAHPQHHYQGRIGQHAAAQSDMKRSTDLRVSGRDEWRDVDRRLLESLGAALDALAAIHPFFASNPFKDVGYNLQRTRPGEYYHWHVDSGPGQFSQRQLVAIWYLNDVPGPGGETEFYFQDLRITPEQGKLILFPPFWTHLHRGVELTSGVKYIATTWVSYS